ncbi:hypothetical protein RA279_28595, partial [Pseudomonas syringae pv. tagetis]
MREVTFSGPAGDDQRSQGPGGAGNSTLAHLVAGVWVIDSCDLLIGGIEALDMGSDYLQKQISLVFQ